MLDQAGLNIYDRTHEIWFVGGGLRGTDWGGRLNLIKIHKNSIIYIYIFKRGPSNFTLHFCISYFKIHIGAENDDTLIIPALRLKQEDCQRLKAFLDYTVSLRYPGPHSETKSQNLNQKPIKKQIYITL